MNSILYFLTAAALAANIPASSMSYANSGFDVKTEVTHLNKQAPGLNKKALEMALSAYVKAKAEGIVKKPLVTVIDYSLPSNKQRMWVFNVSKDQLLYNTYVAHGKNSGVNVASQFSNNNSSKQSSIGTFVTKGTYYGSKGYALNLAGLEKGINSNAFKRRIVIHGAWYVEPSFIKKVGRTGRSWGCPAIAKSLSKPLINSIKNGSLIFAYYPDNYYLSHSRYAVA